MSDPPIIEARDLHTYYGASHILRGIDFTVRRGEAVGLMGRNGMGKTTLVRSLAGHVPARRGEIRIHDQVMTGAAPHRIARRGIAYVPEGRGIFGNLTVKENLIMAARPASDGKSHWSLQKVLQVFPQLEERLARGGQQLSGGEQQMLSIARALMTNPTLLFFDEASEGLAPLVAKEIWRIIAAIKDAGIATVVVDKNFAAVAAHTDRNVILVKGRVVFEGTGGELKARPELVHEYLGI
jgi:branched-chain amino acid transport system ATP-binding protein